MGKSFEYLKLNFTPNTLGCYGLISFLLSVRICTCGKIFGGSDKMDSTSVSEAEELSRRGAAAVFQTRHLQRGSQAAIPPLPHLKPEDLHPRIHSEQVTIRG